MDAHAFASTVERTDAAQRKVVACSFADERWHSHSCRSLLFGVVTCYGQREPRDALAMLEPNAGRCGGSRAWSSASSGYGTTSGGSDRCCGSTAGRRSYERCARPSAARRSSPPGSGATGWWWKGSSSLGAVVAFLQQHWGLAKREGISILSAASAVPSTTYYRAVKVHAPLTEGVTCRTALQSSVW